MKRRRDTSTSAGAGASPVEVATLRYIESKVAMDIAQKALFCAVVAKIEDTLKVGNCCFIDRFCYDSIRTVNPNLFFGDKSLRIFEARINIGVEYRQDDDGSPVITKVELPAREERDFKVFHDADADYCDEIDDACSSFYRAAPTPQFRSQLWGHIAKKLVPETILSLIPADLATIAKRNRDKHTHQLSNIHASVNFVMDRKTAEVAFGE